MFLLQVIDGVTSLTLCPQVVSQAPEHFSSFEKKKKGHLWGLLCSPVYLLGHFPSLRYVQGSTRIAVFEGGCRPSTYSCLGFPFHFSLFVASSFNMWGWWHVWPDCHLFISLKPVLNWANVCSPNILRTARRTMIRFLIELLVRRTWFEHLDELYSVLNWLVMRCKLRPELAADAQQTAWSKM